MSCESSPETLQRLATFERRNAGLRRALGHDLPNLLVAIQGMARLLDEAAPGQLSAEAREYVARLSSASRRAHEMVALLADLTRLTREAGRHQANLAVTAAEATSEVARLFPRRAIRYHLHEAAGTLPLPPKHLRILLVQLLRNAIASVPMERVAEVRIERLEDATQNGFRVVDAGVGFAPDALGRLRDFLAGGEMLGTGLGLFLAREILYTWDGVIHIDSAPGQGCAVTILFPNE
jgi:signal transduction histidine kinase